MDTILIWECPHCSDGHLYSVEVSRSHWMGAYYVPARPLDFTRLLTCPSTGEDFQVTMHLIQPHGVDYEQLSVGETVDIKIDPNDLPTNTSYYDEIDIKTALLAQGVHESDLRVPPGGIEYQGVIILGIYGL